MRMDDQKKERTLHIHIHIHGESRNILVQIGGSSRFGAINCIVSVSTCSSQCSCLLGTPCPCTWTVDTPLLRLALILAHLHFVCSLQRFKNITRAHFTHPLRFPVLLILLLFFAVHYRGMCGAADEQGKQTDRDGEESTKQQHICAHQGPSFVGLTFFRHTHLYKLIKINPSQSERGIQHPSAPCNTCDPNIFLDAPSLSSPTINHVNH